MTTPDSSDQQLKLEYETPQFLHSLFANDPQELHYFEKRLGLRTVTREGWLLMTGSGPAVGLGKKVFVELEEARRQGARISSRDFRLAVDLVIDGSEVGVAELAGLRLLGSRSRRTVAPRTPNQLAYLTAMRENPIVFGLGPLHAVIQFLRLHQTAPTIRAIINAQGYIRWIMFEIDFYQHSGLIICVLKSKRALTLQPRIWIGSAPTRNNEKSESGSESGSESVELAFSP